MNTIQLNSSSLSHYFTSAEYIVGEEKSEHDSEGRIFGPIWIYYSSTQLAKKFKEMSHRFPSIVEEVTKTKDQETMRTCHSDIKNLLDSTIENESFIRVSERGDNQPWTLKPMVKFLFLFIEVLKEQELKLRVAAYPDRNKAPLTYDELHELNHLTDLSF